MRPSFHHATRRSLGLVALIALTGTGPATAQTCYPPPDPPTFPWEEIQSFPAGGPMQTAWKVHFAHATGKGLFIPGAWFKKSPSSPWMRVLWDARTADIFVPYHSGSPRYYDLTGFNFSMVPATAADAGCCGQILDGVVIKEVRDRGILWKDDMTGRRGQELVLLATIDAANYNSVFQYGFRDDGTITLRLGATARNLPGREYEAHSHTTLWRVDVELGGSTTTRRSSPVISSRSLPCPLPTAPPRSTAASRDRRCGTTSNTTASGSRTP